MRVSHPMVVHVPRFSVTYSFLIFQDGGGQAKSRSTLNRCSVMAIHVAQQPAVEQFEAHEVSRKASI